MTDRYKYCKLNRIRRGTFFLIVGTQRAGTTSLYYFLKQHPEIYLPKRKELHFFDLNWHRGIRWYLSHFEDAIKEDENHVKAIGEITPSYMYLDFVPRRIKMIFPTVKLIFILRNPVDRAYSHYWHEVKLGYEFLPFEQAILKEKVRLARGDIFSKLHYSYLDRGKYVVQIKRFIKLFPRDNLLFILFDELKKDPATTMRKIYNFLGIKSQLDLSYFEKTNIGVSPRFWSLQTLRAKFKSDFMKLCVWNNPLLESIFFKKGYPPMNPQTRKYLINYFEEYNTYLEKLLYIKIPSTWFVL